MLAVLSPGQGSQQPGFLEPWLVATPTAEARLRWWSVLAGVDLVHLGTTAGADEITDTANTQPLLVAAALLAAEDLAGADVTVLAGHSVGEFAAAALAGVLTSDAAVALAGLRGREMAAACALEKFTAQPPPKARVKQLPVAGAFHTPYMAPAERALAAAAAGVTPADPSRILVSNLDGASVDHGRELVGRLVRQVTAPVRWDACMRTLADLGVTGVIELPPAGTLAGLLKRELTGPGRPEIVTLKTPDDLDAARDLIARHGTAPSHEPAPQFRVVVAGSAGTFEPAAGLAEGDRVGAGQVIGHVATRQGQVEVTAHDAGTLAEWLAHHDDPVAPGQPLARIGGHP